MGFPAFLILIVASSATNAAGENTLSTGHLLRTNQTRTSLSGTFALGFFDSGNSTHHRFHLAIWYNQIPGRTVVWVANRNTSLTDPDGGAAISSDDGNLVVLDRSSAVVWSSGMMNAVPGTTAVLEESGNLVLRSGDGGSVVWQSFDFPSDTMLPGMTLRMNLTTGKLIGLVSWRTPDDPSPGDYYFGPDPLWPVQLIIARVSGQRMWRSTMWNNRVSSDVTTINNGVTSFAMYLTVTTVRGEIVWTQAISDASLTWMSHLNSSGTMEMRTWLPEAGVWGVPWYRPRGPCRLYAPCGPNGVCNMNKLPVCSCLTGFRPKREADWNNGNWSAGCERADTGENCGQGQGDGFLRMGPIKLPDFPISIVNLSEGECATRCLTNCSCTAYSYANVTLEPSPRCLQWIGRLLDIEDNFTGTGQDLYIRLSKDELDRLNNTISKSSKRLIWILVTTLCGGVVICSIILYLMWRRYKSQDEVLKMMGFASGGVGENLPFFSFSSLQAATNRFSTANKLGEGGFGSVYKGKLLSGQEIAVKRLAKSSGQGLEEFKTEVELIAKLQHRNLVRLLGWCKLREEKLLIYEFMPNKSLDKILFDPALRLKFDWGKRFHIAQGIAQGLLYIHKHSRLKIVHRDLKPSNILLDAEMNPKISDFGLARIVGGKQSRANTKRVMGTYGYMSPEYALHGEFSEKSDVYSFGVILLELVCGKRATGAYPLDNTDNLLGYAWTLWTENRCLELIDTSLSMTEELARCIHVALLCVQEVAADRPSMSSVVVMLSSENPSMPFPKEPPLHRITSPLSSDTFPLIDDNVKEEAEYDSIISASYYEGR